MITARRTRSAITLSSSASRCMTSRTPLPQRLASRGATTSPSRLLAPCEIRCSSNGRGRLHRFRTTPLPRQSAAHMATAIQVAMARRPCGAARRPMASVAVDSPPRATIRILRLQLTAMVAAAMRLPPTMRLSPMAMVVAAPAMAGAAAVAGKTMVAALAAERMTDTEVTKAVLISAWCRQPLVLLNRLQPPVLLQRLQPLRLQ
mmetsp:Transcript_107838/g.303855  ORF Transcript_107838/g.303855 Transcript_107838/m.303855 type:complete len:204 (+) Transcript_107838:254-865(+)